jgi:tetratricopeptide (TPR) repeat protein
MQMPKVSALAAGAFAAALVSVPALAEDRYAEAIAEVIKEPARLVGEWERYESLAFAMAIAILVIGAVIVLCQTFKLKCKSARLILGITLVTALLGGLVSVLTGVTDMYLDYDHRQYRTLASQGRHALAEIRIKTIRLGSLPADQVQAREAIFEEIRKEANEVLRMPQRLKEYQAASPARRSFAFVIGTAHAQKAAPGQAAPDWLSMPPPDKNNLYFVGYADSRDYAAARQLSRERALEEATVFLTDRFQASNRDARVDSGALAAYLAESARFVADHYAYDDATKLHRFYSLLQLNRQIAESDLRVFAAKSGVAQASALQQPLREAQRTQNDYLANRLAVYTAQLDVAQRALPSSAYDEFARGRSLRRENRLPEAIAILERVVSASPEFYLAWFNLALAYDDAGNAPLARRAYQRAVELERAQNVGDASLYNSYGFFLYRAKDYPAAIENLRRALDIAPDHPKARNTLNAAVAGARSSRN